MFLSCKVSQLLPEAATSRSQFFGRDFSPTITYEWNDVAGYSDIPRCFLVWICTYERSIAQRPMEYFD